MERVQMGTIYFKLDDTTETQEKLNEFFEKYGFKIIKKFPLGKETYFNRVTRFSNGKGLEFDIVWFTNLAHIRFGNWETGYIENQFTNIKGSYIPDCDHNTFDFTYKGERTLKLSVPIIEL